MMEQYSEWQDLWVDRNSRHTKAMEQAAFDRNLFINTKPTKHVELKYPECVSLSLSLYLGDHLGGNVGKGSEGMA